MKRNITVCEALGKSLGVACLAALLAAIPARGEPPPGSAKTQEPSRILKVEDMSGDVMIQRAGRELWAQPGYLVFHEERVALRQGARLGLRLAAHGRIDLAPIANQAALITDKLPFSSWAVDLTTRLRLESGALRVAWSRPTDDAKWPFSVLLGPWIADISSGEYLFRRSGGETLACNVSGRLTISDGGNWEYPVSAQSCLRLDRGPATRQLAATDWPELEPRLLAAVTAPVRTASGAATQPAASEQGLGLAAALEVALAAEPPGAGTSEAVPADADSGSTKRPEDQSPVAAGEAKAAVPVAVPPTAASPVAQGEVALAAGAAAPPAMTKSTAVISSPGAVIGAPPSPGPADLSRNPVPVPNAGSAPAPVEETATAATTGSATAATPATPETQAPAGAATDVAVTSPAPTAPPPGPEWIVNVTSFSSPVEADEHVQILVKAGYPASLRTEMVRGRASYRVVVQGLTSQQAAERTVGLLADKMGYTTAWVLQKR
ncbi:MAG: SPOR domain-containing protein [Panacagrimonas sp.]